MLDPRAMPAMSQIFARRIGRIVFGGVLIAGVAYLVAAACAGLSGSPWILGGRDLGAARIIGVTWLVAALASTIARRIASRMRWAGGPDRLFAESMMAPAMGIALLLPITLHLPVVLLLSDAAAFDTWVVASMWITALPHAVFAFACAVRAYQLVADRTAWSPNGVYVMTLVTSCVPFVVLYAVPPALVAVTALPFIPMMRAMERIVVRERAEAAAAPQLLPRAVVRISRHA
jgi:hypothetical protein